VIFDQRRMLDRGYIEAYHDPFVVTVHDHQIKRLVGIDVYPLDAARCRSG
jgi:hypothetical protein